MQKLVKKNFYFLLILQIVSGLLAFLSSIALANIFSKEDFGIYKFILALAPLISLFTLKEVSKIIISKISGKDC